MRCRTTATHGIFTPQPGVSLRMNHLLLLFCLGLPRLTEPAPPLEPLQIAEQFVAPGGWEPMKSYLCCEAAGQAKAQTLGQQIPARVARTCQLVQQGTATAVVAVELRDSLGRRDFYLHFTKEDAGWKLGAVRNLAMTHLGPPMVGILAAMPPAEVAAYDRKHPQAPHAFTLGNMRLWMGADADLGAHFARHRADFDHALRLLQAGRYFAAPTADTGRAGERAANANPALRALLRRLYISRVGRRDTGCATCVEFVVGGLTGNTVGLLYEPNPAAVPAMSPNRLIVVKPLGQGWYLYKTT